MSDALDLWNKICALCLYYYIYSIYIRIYKDDLCALPLNMFFVFAPHKTTLRILWHMCLAFWFAAAASRSLPTSKEDGMRYGTLYAMVLLYYGLPFVLFSIKCI